MTTASEHLAKLAVLIDAESISPKIVSGLFKEIATIGEASVRRIYGDFSGNLRAEFEEAGFPLRTTQIQDPGLIEVYPSPALVELTGASERLPYKLAKTRTYWKARSPI